MIRQLSRLLTLFGLALLIGSAWADKLAGRVVGIADGDTPALRHRRAREAPSLREVIEAAPLGSGIRQDGLGGLPKRDRYQRILGEVLVNGADAGLDQIRSGLAWHYKKYEREQSPEDRLAYARAEERPARSGAVSGRTGTRYRPGPSAGAELWTRQSGCPNGPSKAKDWCS
ncbi:MAG: thermonuclease family protein [Gammaproteobacteria bacterium]